jgi:Zn-dependent M16 (insulinase) family peptidase
MDDTQVAAIIDNTARLKERQSAIDPPDLLAKLPSLTLADLEQRNKPIPVEFSTLDGATLLYHDLFTNGIVYLNLGWDIHRVPQHLLPYVKLFGQALVEMGTEKEDYVRLNQRIGRKTGGVWPSSFTSPVRNDSGGAAWFFLSGKATAAQTPELLAIMHDVLATVKLDNPERFRQIVLKTKARSEAGLAPSGHEVVHGRLAATFAPANWATEQMGGLNWLFFLRRLEERIVSDWPGVLADLEATRRALINRGGMVANVTLDAINWQNLQPQIADLLAALPDGAATAIPWQPDPFPPHEGLTIPAQVNYVGKGANLYEVGYEYHGSVNVIANYLRTTWLWDKVRVQGGAYGGMCRFGKQSGLMAFLSYRDPNLLAPRRPERSGADAQHHWRDQQLRPVSTSRRQGLHFAHSLPDGRVGRESAAHTRRNPGNDGSRFSLLRRSLGRGQRTQPRRRHGVERGNLRRESGAQ